MAAANSAKIFPCKSDHGFMHRYPGNSQRPATFREVITPCQYQSGVGLTGHCVRILLQCSLSEAFGTGVVHAYIYDWLIIHTHTYSTYMYLTPTCTVYVCKILLLPSCCIVNTKQVKLVKNVKALCC